MRVDLSISATSFVPLPIYLCSYFHEGFEVALTTDI